MGGILGRIQQKSCTSISFSTPFDANICKKNGRRLFFAQNIRFMVILFIYKYISFTDIYRCGPLLIVSISVYCVLSADAALFAFSLVVTTSSSLMVLLIETNFSRLRIARPITTRMATTATISINLRIICLAICLFLLLLLHSLQLLDGALCNIVDRVDVVVEARLVVQAVTTDVGT